MYLLCLCLIKANLPANGEIIHNNTNIILRNLGFQRDSFTGNLIIKFKIDYPKTLPKEVILKLREIL